MSDIDPTLEAQLSHCLQSTDFPGLGTRRQGKVRDIYERDQELILVTTDRVSAFDHVLGTVPFKGAILNRMAHWGFETTQDILTNHLIDAPDPQVMVVKKCRPYPVEFVVRGYVAGSLFRDLKSGEASAYELQFPDGIRENEALPHPMLTPSTKAEQGTHDRPTSRREILARGWMTAAQFDQAEAAALALYERGRTLAAERGLILVDTKYELGVDPAGTLCLIDELHTADSSRYWRADSYRARFEAGKPPEMLDKENLRSWLRTERGYTGEGEPPALDASIRVLLAHRYLTACRELTAGTPDLSPGPVSPRIERNLEAHGILPS